MERWKAIPGYEGIYEASDTGKIRSAYGKTTSSKRFKRRVWKQRVLKPKFERSRQRQDERVELWKNGQHKTFLVSRLIAMTWIGLPGEAMTVNHINGDWRDNRPENLEWVSLAKNVQLAFQNGQMPAQIRVVLCPVEDENKRISFVSMSKASSWLGHNDGYISLCIKRGRLARSADGYKYHIVIDKGETV